MPKYKQLKYALFMIREFYQHRLLSFNTFNKLYKGIFTFIYDNFNYYLNENELLSPLSNAIPPSFLCAILYLKDNNYVSWKSYNRLVNAYDDYLDKIKKGKGRL